VSYAVNTFNVRFPVNENGDDDEDDEDSDDDVHVVIGDIKTSPTYTSLNIKRGGLLTSAAGGEKLKVSC
jgi:pre-mRNA 3'-end-processing factor FIP1